MRGHTSWVWGPSKKINPVSPLVFWFFVPYNEWSQSKRKATVLRASSLQDVVACSSSVSDKAVPSPKSLSPCLRMQILYMCNIMKTNACHQLPVFHHQTLQERGCATKTAAETIYLDRGFIYKRWQTTKMLCIRMYSNKWGNIRAFKTFKLSKSILILIKWK